MATTTVSFRADAELLAELESLTRTTGKDRSAVVIELLRIGLEAKRGEANDLTATTLAELVTEVRRLRARLKKGSASSELATVLKGLGDELGELMAEQQAKATTIITHEIATLRQHVRRSFGNYLRIAFKLSEEEAREHVCRAFDS